MLNIGGRPLMGDPLEPEKLAYEEFVTAGPSSKIISRALIASPQ
jgi:hypothetical protein